MKKSFIKNITLALSCLLGIGGLSLALATSTNNSYIYNAQAEDSTQDNVSDASASITNGETTTYYSDFASALSNWADGTSLKLLKDIAITSTITINNTKTLDLNGYGLRASTTGFSIIRVNSGGNLTILDSDPEHAHAITLSNYRGTGVSDGTGTTNVNDSGTGTAYIEGGYITGGDAGLHGSGFYLNGGTVNFYGGTVIGNYLNQTNNCGSAVYALNSSKFYMYGGQFIYNYAQNASAVFYFNNSYLEINDGYIAYNKDDWGSGVVIEVIGSSTIKLYGGLIENNISKNLHGVISFTRGNPVMTQYFGIKGSPITRNNTYYDAGGGESANIRLYTKIHIEGELNDDAKLGVVLANNNIWPNNAGCFTDGWSKYMGNANPADYFINDNKDHADYKIYLKDGEVWSGSAHTVTFNTQGHGTAPSPIYVEDGSTFAKPDNPISNGYGFLGWYKEDSCLNEWDFSSDTVTGDITLYAKWGSYHEHNFSYTVDGDSITVECHQEDCYITSGLTLTLEAPTSLAYDGTAKTISFAPGYSVEAFENPTISYYKDGVEVEECINAGTYEARVTIGGVTATKSFTISKLDPNYTLPTGIKGMSDQKLSEIELPTNWSWANPDALVGDGKDIDIIYTPEDEINYNIINKKIDIEATQRVRYRAWNGTSVVDVEDGCLEFTIISEELTSLTSGWYVVNSDVIVPTRITVTGEVHLIIVDGCTLTANEGISVNEGNTLNIYGQSLGTGKLVATSNDNANAVIGGDAEVNSGTINIHGGIIEATTSSESDGAAIGGGYSASAGVMNVYGGTVNAIGNAKTNAIGKGVEGISDGTLNVANNLVVLGNNESSPTYPVDEKIDYASNRYKYMTIGTFVTGEKVTYGLYIGDVEVSNYNLLINSVDSSDIKNGSAVFDPETYTLTLTNFEYIGSGFSQGGWEAGVIDYRGNKDLTINIVGTNKIHKVDSNSIGCSYGIFYEESNLTIKGTGSLHISFSEDRRGSKSNGIFTDYGSFTMESGTVEVYAGIGDESAAIYTGSGITFNGGYFKGVGNTTTNYESRGIYSHGSITINGGKVLGYAPLVHNKEAYGFHGSVTIKGGEVIAYSQNPFSSGVSIKVPAAIYAGADENSLAKYGYIPSSEKYIYINAGHQHDFKYTVDGASITAECQEENCNVTSGLTLTLEAPTNLVYDGTAKSISFAPGYSAEAFATPTISYYKDGVEVEECIDVGTYEARVTFKEATAKITFTITQATPTGYDIPGGLQATYGDDLSSVNLPINWNWKNPNDKVGNAGINNHIAIYTPSDNNYKSVEEELVIGVSKANPIVPIIYDMEVPYDVELSTIGLPSGFSWMDPTLRTNKWGNNLFHVRYTPTDTANYNEVDFVNVTLNVKWILVDPTMGDVSVIINDQDESFTVNINVKVEVKTEITVDEKRDNYSSLADYGLVNSNEDINAIYDVKLIRTTNGVEEEIQPSDIKEGTKITVSMAIPEELVGKDFRLVHIHNANDISEVTDYAISKDGKTLMVEVDRLSEFAFIGATDVDNGFIYNVTPIWAIILLIIFGIILLVGVYVLYRLIKDRNDNSNNGNNKSVKAMSISFIAPLYIVLSAVSGVVVAFIVVAILAGLVWGANLTLFLLRKKRNENIVNKVEVVSSSTSNDEEEEEESITLTDEKGNIFNIRYIKSFTAKLIQSGDETKKYYEELKNYILSYKKTNNRISWHYDSVNSGRNQVLKFAIRGKTLCVYLPLNADDYLDTKYKVEKSESKKYEEVPCLYRIKNDRRLGYAKELMDVVASNLGLTKGEEQHEVYSNLPYEPNKPLIERGLIKELKVQVNKPAVVNEDEEESVTITDEKGNIFNIRYVKSFTAKLIQASEETKKYYEELKNEVLSYKSTHSRISWHYDSVNAGRNQVLKFAVRGKTLCVYLPLNPDDYLDSKYKVEKSESKKYEEVPCLYRIKNDRRLGYAKELIALVAANLGLEKGEEQHEVYSNLPYEPNKPLIERGLIKELKVQVNKPATQVVDSIINADGDEIITTKDDKGNIFEIRFVKSFTAKLIQSSDETKKYYEELKNEVLSYKSTHSRVSWHYDSINAGRNYVLRFVIRGKTLCVYLPLNADDYGESKYKVEKSESKKYEEVPCLYRIKNDRRLGYAKELIAVVAANLGLTKGEEQHEVYSNLPYEPNKPLIERGLIKELKTKVIDKEVIEKYESITVEKADKAMTDEKAEAFIEEINVEKARHGKKEIINIDTLSEHFNDGDEVTIDALIDKKLVHSSTGHVKALARGSLNKKLDVKLNDYSIQAVKMILLMGGHVKKIK